MIVDRDLIVALAQEIEKDSPIEWGYLEVDQQVVYSTLATSLADMFNNQAPGEREYMLLAIMCKTLVENMVLNVRLMKKYEDLGKKYKEDK